MEEERTEYAPGSMPARASRTSAASPAGRRTPFIRSRSAAAAGTSLSGLSKGRASTASQAPGTDAKNSAYPCGVTIKPGGTGKPARKSLERLEPLPPLRGSSSASGSLNFRT